MTRRKEKNEFNNISSTEGLLNMASPKSKRHLQVGKIYIIPDVGWTFRVYKDRLLKKHRADEQPIGYLYISDSFFVIESEIDHDIGLSVKMLCGELLGWIHVTWRDLEQVEELTQENSTQLLEKTEAEDDS